MGSIRVDRMRKVLAASREDTERRQYAAWLGGLTPEHRRKHTPPMSFGGCTECFAANWAAISAQLSRSLQTMTTPRATR
jgi:hypothetical protein